MMNKEKFTNSSALPPPVCKPYLEKLCNGKCMPSYFSFCPSGTKICRAGCIYNNLSCCDKFSDVVGI